MNPATKPKPKAKPAAPKPKPKQTAPKPATKAAVPKPKAKSAAPKPRPKQAAPKPKIPTATVATVPTGGGVATWGGYNQDQVNNQQIVVSEGEKRNASELALLGALCAGSGENNWHSQGCNASNHCGFWQLNSTWQAMHDYRDVGWWTGYAYDKGFYGHGGIVHIAAANPSLTPGWVAQYCQGAGPSDAAAAAYYETHLDEARKVLAHFKGSGGSGAAQPTVKDYADPLAEFHGIMEREDQGVDVAGTGYIDAFADCEITAADNNSDGWGYTDANHRRHSAGYLEYKITTPNLPMTGDFFYCAEGVTTGHHVGDTVKAGGRLVELRPGWPTGVELGQAAGNGNQQTWAAVFGGGYTEGQRTAAGVAFSNLLQRLSGRSGTAESRPIVGSYPRWAPNGGVPTSVSKGAVSGSSAPQAAGPTFSYSSIGASILWPGYYWEACNSMEQQCGIGSHHSNAGWTFARNKKYVTAPN